MKGRRKGQQVKEGKRKSEHRRPDRPSDSDAVPPDSSFFFMRDEQTTPATGCEIRVFSLRVGTHTLQTAGQNYDFSIGVVTEELKLQRRAFLGCHWENTKFFHTRSASFEMTEHGNWTIF